MDGLYVTSRSTPTAPRLTGTTLKSKLKNLRVVRRNGRVSGLQDPLQMWHFSSKGCRSNGVGLRLVLWQLFWTILGKSLFCLSCLFFLSSSWPIHLMLCRREEPVTGRPFLEGRILGLSWVIVPNRIKREGPLKKGQNKA